MASTRQELTALRNMISEAELILSTSELPEGRAVRSRELLVSALALADDLLASAKAPAAALDRKGGTVTAQKGSDQFRQLAAMRKAREGGRPRKENSGPQRRLQTMSETLGYKKCEMPGCTSPANEKCEHCNRDVCGYHMKESGDEDLCTACANVKRRG